MGWAEIFGRERRRTWCAGDQPGVGSTSPVPPRPIR